MSKVLDFILSQPWAIQPDALQTIVSIACRNNEAPELLETKLGKPLRNTRAVEIRGNTAVIPVMGPIFRYANIFTEISGATSLEVLARDFQTAVDSKAVENIVLNIDSPGGMAAGIAEFAALIRSSEKPVYGYVGDLAASAGYWVAAATKQIFMAKTAMVGSIGAVVNARMKDSASGEIEIVSAQSPKKRMDPGTKEGRAELQAMIDTLAQIFIDDVAEFRGVAVEKVLADFGQGGMKIGVDALAAGMADGITTFETLIAGLSGDNSINLSKVQTMAGENKPVLTLDQLKAEHPELAKQLQDEGANTALNQLTDEQSEIATKAKAEETKRVNEVLALNSFGFDKELQAMAADGKTTAAQAALKLNQLQAEAHTEGLQKFKDSAPKAVQTVVEDTKPKMKNNFDDLPKSERYKAEWDADADIRNEFMEDFETYAAYREAHDDGLIKVLKK